jgi:DNA-binding response OmpR family regulator
MAAKFGQKTPKTAGQLLNSIYQFWKRTDEMYNILLVEDEEDILLANKILFERRGGYIVRTAKSLAEAAEHLDDYVPDAIVLDVNLPDGNGLEFLKELRGKKSIDVPVLILTALSDSSDEIKALQAGGDDYISKPFDNAILLARLKRLLQRAMQMPETLVRGSLRVETSSKKAYANGEDMCLPAKEYSLLEMFLQHPERIIPAVHLYEKIWGAKWQGDDKALKSTISKLRSALTKYDADFTITSSRGEGYYLERP